MVKQTHPPIYNPISTIHAEWRTGRDCLRCAMAKPRWLALLAVFKSPSRTANCFQTLFLRFAAEGVLIPPHKRHDPTPASGGGVVADREGFEPSVTLPPHTLSKRAHSTTLTPALGEQEPSEARMAWQSIFGQRLRRNEPVRPTWLQLRWSRLSD